MTGPYDPRASQLKILADASDMVAKGGVDGVLITILVGENVNTKMAIREYDDEVEGDLDEMMIRAAGTSYRRIASGNLVGDA